MNEKFGRTPEDALKRKEERLIDLGEKNEEYDDKAEKVAGSSFYTNLLMGEIKAAGGINSFLREQERIDRFVQDWGSKLLGGDEAIPEDGYEEFTRALARAVEKRRESQS